MQDETRVALAKREERGLLAGFYEFPCLPGKQSDRQVLEYLKRLGFVSLRIQKIGEAKHIFSHVEWHMKGYRILLKGKMPEGYYFVDRQEIRDKNIPLPQRIFRRI